MATKNLLFFGGIPLAPDVKKLEEAFGVPEEDLHISWDEMETVLGMERKSNRFKSVWAAWSKQLFAEHNVVMKSIGNGQGVKALIPDDRIKLSVNWLEQSAKRIRRAIKVADQTDDHRLSDESIKVKLSIVKMREIKMDLYRSVQPKQLPDATQALSR